MIARPLPTSARDATSGSPAWLAAARRAKFLSWLSLVWMSLEGGIAITAGILAGSIALIGFGIDSAIEGMREPRDRLALHRRSAALPRG